MIVINDNKIYTFRLRKRLGMYSRLQIYMTSMKICVQGGQISLQLTALGTKYITKLAFNRTITSVLINITHLKVQAIL